MRKHLLLILFLSGTTLLFAQTDTVTLKSGKVIIGKCTANYDEYIQMTTAVEPLNESLLLPKDSIAALAIHQQRSNFTETAYLVTLTKVSDLAIDTKQFKPYNHHLKQAGVIGLTGAFVTITGTVLSVVGSTQNIPAVTYAGAGLSGFGGLLSIIGIGKLIPASKWKEPKLVKF